MEKVKVKILGISCAHRKGRNTAWLTLYALKAAEKFGRRINRVAEIETEFIDLSLPGKELRLCDNCDQHCEILNRGLPWKGTEVPRGFACPIEDDYVARELLSKMARADGFIFGSPVFTLSYTSKFRLLCDRLRAGVGQGYFTNKPAGAVTTATMAIGGQESCLEFMSMCIRELEMLPTYWGHGASSVSGPPYGPLPVDDDGTAIGVKKDRYGQWMAALVGRRVVEVAVMQKVAQRRLGSICKQEFIQIYHPPHGEASWEWDQLDKEDEDYMMSLDSDALKRLDGLVTRTKDGQDEELPCKFLGLSCGYSKGDNTAWLVLYSLKGIERLGRRLAGVASFQTEFIDLADKDIKPCRNCSRRYEIPNRGQPWKGGEMPQDFGCILTNDYLAQEIIPRMGLVDGFIFGSPVSTLTPSSKFRLLSERYAANIWRGHLTSKPSANIAVGYAPNSGQDTTLHMMNTCNRAVELIPVSWPHGTAATSGPPFGPISAHDNGKTIGVKNDESARFRSIYNARRVAEFALISKIAKQELGALYVKEFMQVLHPPHGEASWEWHRLDKEDESYLMSLTPKMLTEISS